MNCDSLIERLCDLGKSGGWPLSPSTDIAFNELIAILNLSQEEESALPKALSLTSKEKVHDTSTLRSNLNKLVEEKRNSRPMTRFDFLLPVDLIFESKSLPTFNFLGEKFQFVSIEWARKKFNISELIDLNSLRMAVHAEVNDFPKVFLFFSSYHRTPEDAYEYFSPTLTSFRGLIEVSMHYLGTVLGFENGPRHSMRHPEWILALKREESLYSVSSIDFIVDPHKPKNQRFDKKALRNARRISRHFFDRPPKTSVFALLVEVFRLYASAMDQRFPHHSFIGFWQAGEAMALAKDSGGHTEVVAKRLNSFSRFWNLIENSWVNILMKYGKIRNEIVHNGIEAANQKELNTLKTIIDLSIMTILRLRKAVKTKHDLNSWYFLNTQTPEKIDSLKRIVSFIQRLKNNT